MNLEALRVLRNVLMRAFVIGVAIMLLYGAAMLLGWKTRAALITDRWHLVDEGTLGIIVACWFALLRFFVVFVLLVPGLAIHWTLLRERRRAKSP